MEKRGQIGFILVIAVIIILAGIGLYVAQKYKIGNYASELDYTTVDPIRNYVTFCLEDSLKEGLIYSGMNGGYIYMPVDLQRLSIDPNLKLSVLYSVGRNRLLPISEIERQLDVYLKERIPSCLDYTEFSKQGFDIREDARNISRGLKTRFGNISTIVKDESVDVEITYPLTIERGGKLYKIDRFSSSVPIRYGLIYKAANETINNLALSDATPAGDLEKTLSPYMDVKTGYSLGFILNSYKEVKVNYFIFDHDISVWSIYDDYGGNDYRFSFAAVHAVKGVE